MTEKQLRILYSALQLFAEQGYNATSTRKVAQNAGVSEGLLFRHFKSKAGLLKAIMEIGRSKIVILLSKISDQDDPRKILKGIIEMPLTIDLHEYQFWRLFYMMNWHISNKERGPFELITTTLIKVFSELQYNNPCFEAELVLILIDGLVINLNDKVDRQSALLNCILKKYKLENI